MATTFAVPDGRVAMAATLYTGNGGTNTISNAVNGVGLQPDLLWTKGRSSAAYHYIQNSVVGVNKALYSNTTDSEYTLTTTTTALNTNGFSFNGPESGLNASAVTYVGWQWKAGGTAVSNTAGTITSSVSANTTAGFSIVTFTGNGVDTLSGVATVGHGLGVTPSFIITKKRSSGTDYNWSTYHISNGNANVWLNTTSGKNSNNWVTAPAATVFTPPVSLYGNESGVNYVAYCWAPVAGYSAFGSYTGNGSADGPFIYTGFRPRFVMIKGSGVAGGWSITDTSRDTYNLTVNKIEANTALSEASNAGIYQFDILSNGFKIRQGTGYGINNAADYIYAAFAENPLKYSNAR